MRKIETNPDSGVHSDGFRALIAHHRPIEATVQDLVLHTIRQAIFDGVLLPGSRLRQEELAEAFAISRIPVREALRALEYEGLLASGPYRGFAVRHLDAAEIEEIYELRTILECHALRIAIPLMTEPDLEELDGLFQGMEAATEPDAALAAREQFYLRLYAMSGRLRLVALIVRLRQEVARFLRWRLIQHSPEHHRLLFQAVKRRDVDAAVAELSGHYSNVAALIRRILREAEYRGDTDVWARRSARPVSSIER